MLACPSFHRMYDPKVAMVVGDERDNNSDNTERTSHGNSTEIKAHDVVCLGQVMIIDQ